MVSALKAPRRTAAGETESRLEDQVGFLIRCAYQRAAASFAAVVDDRNLTPTQFAALLKLGEADGLSQNHLGRLTAMDPATIQGVIRRLEARALIERTTDPGDRRRTILRLSPDGRSLLARLVPCCANINERVLAPLSPSERHLFLTLLRRLT